MDELLLHQRVRIRVDYMVRRRVLPGDTLIVTSYTNGFSIEVLILSSIDSSSGIAIELSEEAAKP